MSKKFYLNKKMMFFILLVLALIFAMPTLLLLNKNAFADGITQLEGSLNIVAKDGTAIIPANGDTYDGSTVQIYKWNEARTLTISYEHSGDMPPMNPEGEYIFTINVTLEYLKGYLDSSFDNHITVENVFDERTGVLPEQLNNQTYYFNIDQGVRFASSQTNIRGWGIYRFKISINGSEKYSNYIFIEPDYQVESAPDIRYNVVHSPNSMHDSFEFYISNSDVFKYVDTNCIKWYVTGESTDGLKYVLTRSDLETERFENYDKCLYENISRSGTSFTFNDNEVSGKWNVWCEFESRGSTTTIVPSTTIAEVQTSQDIRVDWVPWVIVSACVVAMGSVALLAFLRSKKEKVW